MTALDVEAQVVLLEGAAHERSRAYRTMIARMDRVDLMLRQLGLTSVVLMVAGTPVTPGGRLSWDPEHGMLFASAPGLETTVGHVDLPTLTVLDKHLPHLLRAARRKLEADGWVRKNTRVL